MSDKTNHDAQGKFRKGNRAATRHGQFGFLSIGSLPKGGSYIRRQMTDFQCALEQFVREQYGELSVLHGLICQSATRHEVAALLAQKYLRDRAEEMSDGDLLAWLRHISVATDARDRCVKALGLKGKPRIGTIDAASYYNPPAEQPDRQEGATDEPAA